jgi:hypothetical protein
MTNQQQAYPDWLTPSYKTRRGRPKKQRQEYRSRIEIVERAIYWAERNDAHLPPYPNPLRNREEFRAWVKAKGYYPIIFSHVWAKKFWGDGKYCTCKHIEHEGKCWEYHLQQQLLYKVKGKQAPLQYIVKFGL